MRWHDEAPEGKLDLLLSLDFRMTSTTLFSDIVLPAATWYEKHDLSSTDMHPFVHAFSPAIAPPWQTRTDFDAFHAIAAAFSGLAAERLGVRKDLVAVPLTHDTPSAVGHELFLTGAVRLAPVDAHRRTRVARVHDPIRLRRPSRHEVVKPSKRRSGHTAAIQIVDPDIDAGRSIVHVHGNMSAIRRERDATISSAARQAL